MTRKLLPLIFLAAAVSAQAQQVTPMQTYLKKHGLEGQITATAGAAKATGISSRLTGIFTGSSNASGMDVEALDTTTYKYSNGRGGDATSGRLDYDTMFYAVWNEATKAYERQYIWTQTFNTAGLADTFTTFNWEAGQYKGDIRYAYQYNAAGAQTAFYSQEFRNATGKWENTFRTTTAYTAGGSIAAAGTDAWGVAGPGWTPFGRFTNTYNAAGRLTSHIAERAVGAAAWQNASRDSYTYDASGNQTTEMHEDWSSAGAWDPVYRYTHYYNAANEIVAELEEVRNSSGLYKDDSIAVSLTTTTPAVQTTTHYRQSNGVWSPTTRSTATLTPAGYPLTAVNETLRGLVWKNSTREFYFYNSYDQLTRMFTQTWLRDSVWALAPNYSDMESRYYYELANTTNTTGTPPLGIGSATAAGSASLIISPVPAGSSLTIALKLDKGRSLAAVVTDAAGRTVAQWADDAGAALYTKDLDVRNLPAGVYFLNMLTAAGEHITRSFTVAH